MTARKPPVVKAWNEYLDLDSGHNFWDRPSPMFRFAFEAGQIHALEATADEAQEGNYHGELVWVWLRNVAQMMRENAR
jgi:hypothetical protein